MRSVTASLRLKPRKRRDDSCEGMFASKGTTCYQGRVEKIPYEGFQRVQPVPDRRGLQPSVLLMLNECSQVNPGDFFKVILATLFYQPKERTMAVKALRVVLIRRLRRY